MSRKVKLVTPKEYAEKNNVAYTTVMYWLKSNRVPGAIKHETPRGPYWELPEDTTAPPKRSGRPKKQPEVIYGTGKLAARRRPIKKRAQPSLFEPSPPAEPKARAKKTAKKKAAK